MPRMGICALLALSACDPPEYPIPGVRTEGYFPTDGARRAEYVNAAPEEVPWTLVVENLLPTESIGNVEVTTFEWSRGDTGDVLGAVKWGWDDGLAIYGWAEGSGAFVALDPPVAVTDVEMRPGDAIPTSSGGTAYTSTYIGLEDCPVAWGMAWEDCLHLTLDDGDGDPMAGAPFAGDYWLVQRYGPAWMHTTGYSAKWDLQRYEWDAEE